MGAAQLQSAAAVGLVRGEKKVDKERADLRQMGTIDSYRTCSTLKSMPLSISFCVFSTKWFCLV